MLEVITKYRVPETVWMVCGAVLIGNASIGEKWAEGIACTLHVGCEYREPAHAPKDGPPKAPQWNVTAPLTTSSTANSSYSPSMLDGLFTTTSRST